MVLVWNQVEYSCRPRDVDQDGKMDPSRGRSFMQALCEKYSPENFPYRPAPGVDIVVTAGPQDPSMKDCLNLPSILVLNSSGITCAGEESEIAALCTHVSELDLSDNKFEDWHEVRKIVSNIPQLEFLNLSSNLLHKTTLEKSCAETFNGIHKLVLNNSQTSWETVHTLLQELPRLEELFLCLNNYDTVICSPTCCHSVKLLHITDNHLQEWCEIRKLGIMFPNLDTLILANNNVLTIDETDDSLGQLFPSLRSINLHKTGLNCWEDIDKLNSFPSLQEVRLLGIPLLEPYSTEQRRKLVIARLPSVSKLNGSAVTDGEREDSERFFIRYHLDMPQGEAPQRYQDLVVKYGELTPLAEVDLRPPNKVKVEVHFDNKMEEICIRLDQTVADLKRQLKPVVQLLPKNMRLFHLDKEAPYGPEELKSGTRALHSYGIHDGDTLIVESKMKCP